MIGRKPLPITNQVSAFRDQHGGMSQAALAEAIGVSRQTVVAIEKGHYSPSLETAFRIARLFGVGLEDVFGWDEA
ncbi:MAG TPA: helix-turn-helix transcriptional regulator [Phenylobacterium sp.]|nr:helix-turn-helix transcriptional regulator [Phenylobacterium sp.]HQN50540.1 helix-turn-helix transcriptional regulator [Phenylobacterium sp.]